MTLATRDDVLAELGLMPRWRLRIGAGAPVDRAARNSAFLRQLVDAGDLFSPQAFTAKDAYAFLKDIPLFEAAGVVTRVPDWWQKERPKRVQVQFDPAP